MIMLCCECRLVVSLATQTNEDGHRMWSKGRSQWHREVQVAIFSFLIEYE